MAQRVGLPPLVGYPGAGFALHGTDGPATPLLAMALSFSSTVVAAKMLEAKRELRAFHDRAAIGILIVQDLLALPLAVGAFLTFSEAGVGLAEHVWEALHDEAYYRAQPMPEADG